MSYLDSQFNNTTSRDFQNFMIGSEIGHGLSRTVYEFLPNKDWVLKVETKSSSFQNVLEWETWREFEHEDNSIVRDWLAPCIDISPCGIFMLQERTYKPKEYPDKIPTWLFDRKFSNFGVLKNGKFVSHDYATNGLQLKGPSKRFVNANWWEWENL